MLVSYKLTKKNKLILAFSTLHKDNKIDEKTGNAAKPKIITLCNVTKGGVGTSDEVNTNYSVSRIKYRWPVSVHFSAKYRWNKLSNYIQCEYRNCRRMKIIHKTDGFGPDEMSFIDPRF